MNNKQPENKSYLTPDALEKQEHLSKEQLASLVQTKPNPDTVRPEANFIDLMAWTEGTFKDYLKD